MVFDCRLFCFLTTSLYRISAFSNVFVSRSCIHAIPSVWLLTMMTWRFPTFLNARPANLLKFVTVVQPGTHTLMRLFSVATCHTSLRSFERCAQASLEPLTLLGDTMLTPSSTSRQSVLVDFSNAGLSASKVDLDQVTSMKEKQVSLVPAGSFWEERAKEISTQR